MKKIIILINSLFNIIVNVGLLFLFMILNEVSLKNDKASIIIFLIPIVSAVFSNLRFIKKFISKFVGFFKMLFSRQSMDWEIDAELFFSQDTPLQDLIENIDLNGYKRVKKDIFKPNHMLMYMDGVRFEAKKNTAVDELSYIFIFSADSSPKSYKNKHEKILIKPFFKQLERAYGNDILHSKYSINASKSLINQDVVDESFNSEISNDYKPIKIKATYECIRCEGTFININNYNFNCISPKYEECFNAFNDYIY